jgi:hypothetical protein
VGGSFADNDETSQEEIRHNPKIYLLAVWQAMGAKGA